jgi:hypothetical protein
MKRKPIQTFLVIAISAFILVFPAYLRSSNLAGVRLFSTDLSFENPDQDDIFPYQHNQSKAFVSSVLTIKLLPGTILFDQISRFWFLVSILDQKALLLRC